MAWFETWIKNDLAKPINVVQLQGVMFNLDNLANKIGVELEYNGQPAALEGTIAGYVIRNDGTTLNLTTNTGKDGNKAWVILPQEAYTVEGPISIVIKLVYNSAETTIGACAGYVTRSRTSSEIAPTGTVIPSLASLEAAIAAANAAAANAADATDYIAPTEEDITADAAHAVGAYFIFTGKLVKATSAIAQGATIVPYASGVTNYNCVEVPNGLSGDVYNVNNTANAAANNAADAQQLVAPLESFAGMPTGHATMAHAAGSYFVYGGVLHMATADIAIGDNIVTTGASANCKAVPGGAMGEVSDLKSAISNVTQNPIIEMTDGGYYVVNGASVTIGSPMLSDRYKYAVVQCNPGDKFTINASGLADRQPWAFTDLSGTILARTNNSAGVDITNNQLITAPADAAYLIINSKKTNTLPSYYGEIVGAKADKNSARIDSIDGLCVAATFNIFDKFALVTNMALKDTGEITYASGYSYVLITIDRGRDASLTRIRFNQKYSKFIQYGSSMDFISLEKNKYAKQLDANCYYIGVQFSDSSVDYDTMMAAYTSDTGAASSNNWDTLFPNIGYVPYRHIDYAQIYSGTDKKYLPEIISGLEDDISKIPPQITKISDTMSRLSPDTVMDALDAAGINVSNDNYTGERVASFTGTSSTKTHATLSMACDPCTCYLLEFRGVTNDDTWNFNSTKGAFIAVEFFDANNAAIGSKYNAFVMGTSTRKYHRYGYVSPFGAKKVNIRFVTRAGSSFSVSNVQFGKINAFPMRQRNGVQLDAHLGMTMIAPRNTMPGFEMAKIAGFDTVILNVQFTSDDVAVVIHDATIDATSDGTGSVSSFTYDQLLTYDFGSWFNAAYTGTKIPTLDEAAGYLASCGIRLAISLHHDLSESQLTAMCAIIRKYYDTPVLIKSSYLSELTYVHGILGDNAEYMQYIGSSALDTSKIDAIAALDYNCVYEIQASYLTAETETALDTLVAYAKQNGVPLSANAVNDPLEMKYLIKHGITRFCTDLFSDFAFPVE